MEKENYKLEFPTLPNGMKPDAVYDTNGSFTAVVITNEAVLLFYWDGVAPTFFSNQAYVRYKI